MSGRNTFANAYINIKDNSVVQVPDPTIIPLHVPLFIGFAETGPIGEPIFGGTNTLQSVFGTQFLEERSPYFNHPSPFLKRTIKYQQAYYIRIADPAATAASVVLLATVTHGYPVPQYVREPNGSLHLVGGVPVPASPATAPGVLISWSTRQLAAGETISTVAATTGTDSSGRTTNTYPIAAFTTWVGVTGNNYGFRLFSNYASSNQNAVNNIASLLYSFQPVILSPGLNIETPIYDNYNQKTEWFSFKNGAYDSTTATFYDLADTVRTNYSGLNTLPYQFYVYPATDAGGNPIGANAIGQAIIAASPELSDHNPYQVDIISGNDTNNNPYIHATVSAGSEVLLNSNSVIYLAGGSDGSLTKSTLETQTIAVLTGALNPLLADSFRYPFTHFYDSGYALDIKIGGGTNLGNNGLMSIWTTNSTLSPGIGRDDVAIDFSTQDVALPANTEEIDSNVGSAILTAVTAFPESTLFGTAACRASIYQQCGTLSDTQLYTKIVPATIDRLIKRCIYNGTDHVTGEPTGRPNSEVTIFNISSLNWTPTTDQQKQADYNAGRNYIQYADSKTLFYPSLLSVYEIDGLAGGNSLLTSSILVDYAGVYLKHIVRRQWTKIVGRTDPPTTLFGTISRAIDAAAAYAFGNYLKTATSVSQTAVDSALGYQQTVTVNVYGNFPTRVWQVIIPINRANG